MIPLPSPAEPSGWTWPVATADRPTAIASGRLIMISPSMVFLRERTPSRLSERGAVGRPLVWERGGAFGERNASSEDGLLDRSRQRLNSSGQSAFAEGFQPHPHLSGTMVRISLATAIPDHRWPHVQLGADRVPRK